MVIPAGTFLMGSAHAHRNERPVHEVYLDAYFIDMYEVTNAQYKEFMDATSYKAPTLWSNPAYNAPNQPVVGVSWYDAVAYAEWAGKRLPTEAEWEKAARGGRVGMKYPWGDTITHDNANYGTGRRGTWRYTLPVGSFPPNGYGLYDTAGNVSEWCADRYDPDYYSVSPRNNPKGPDMGMARVLRGGSWNSHVDYLRVASRFYWLPAYTFSNVGFRCAVNAYR